MLHGQVMETCCSGEQTEAHILFSTLFSPRIYRYCCPWGLGCQEPHKVSFPQPAQAPGPGCSQLSVREPAFLHSTACVLLRTPHALCEQNKMNKSEQKSKVCPRLQPGSTHPLRYHNHIPLGIADKYIYFLAVPPTPFPGVHEDMQTDRQEPGLSVCQRGK